MGYNKSWYDYDYGGGFGWGDGNITSWASKWTYEKPDYQKVKDQLMTKQKEMNAKGISIKIGYGPTSLLRKSYGIVKTTCNSLEKLDFINTFLKKTKDMGIMVLAGVDNNILRAMLGEGGTWDDGKKSSSDRTILDSKEEYLSIRDAYKEKKGKKQKEDVETWGGSSSYTLYKLDVPKINKIAEEIKNKIRIKEVIFSREENMRRGQRINRKFVNQLSYKPLVVNKYDKINKKKCLCVLDSSGSMSGEPHENARNFMEAIAKTGIFETKLFYSSSMCIYKSNNVDFLSASGGEGFELLQQRLELVNVAPSDYQYIFVFTDLNIGTVEVEQLQEMVKGKKHILFNFRRSGDKSHYQSLYPDLKIVNTFEVNSMIETLINYV